MHSEPAVHLQLHTTHDCTVTRQKAREIEVQPQSQPHSVAVLMLGSKNISQFVYGKGKLRLSGYGR